MSHLTEERNMNWEGFIDEFEITSVNADCKTSGREWVQAGYKGGYLNGFMAAVRLFAWWKDGTEYVGCGNLTKKEALEMAIRELQK